MYSNNIKSKNQKGTFPVLRVPLVDGSERTWPRPAHSSDFRSFLAFSMLLFTGGEEGTFTRNQSGFQGQKQAQLAGLRLHLQSLMSAGS